MKPETTPMRAAHAGSSERDLRRQLYTAALMALYLPPFIGGTLMGVAGYYPLPQFYGIFISYSGAYVLGVSVLVLGLVPRATRALGALAALAPEARTARIVRQLHGLLRPALLAVSLYSILGALSANFSLVELGVRGPYTWDEHLRTMLGLIPVVLITTFPIFFYLTDAIGRYLAERGALAVITPLSTKLLVLGLFTPILIDTLLISYFFNLTGSLRGETLVLWLGLILVAGGGTWLAWKSINQGMQPLRDFIGGTGSAITTPGQLKPRSLDEFGLLTGQLRLRLDAERRLHAIVEAAPDLVAIADPDGRLTYLNAGGRRMLGLPDDFDVTTTRIPDYHDPETAARILQEVLPACVQSGYWEGENAFRRRDGSSFPGWQVIMVHRGPDGKITSLSTITRDLSERKKAEEQLRELNADLELRVEKRTLDLERMNFDLQDSLTDLRHAQAQLVQSEKMSALGGLVAGVAHEINTPVGIGVTAASHLHMTVQDAAERYRAGQLTRRDMDEFLSNSAEAAQMVLSNLRRAADLIRSFKQVAVDQASAERRQFGLKAYLEEVLISLSPTLKRTRHTVHIDCPPELQIYSQPGAYSQIITNLVMNSVTHGFDGIEAGQITIELREQPGGLLIHYTDDGRGIAAEHLDKIFDPFFTTRRGQGGSGLGLHIVYNLATQTLGGSIACSSAPGKGVAFDIRIALPPAAPGTLTSEPVGVTIP